MAGKINLDPAKGVELAEVLTKFCDQEVQERAQAAYDAARSLGDDNHLVEEYKAKMAKFQDNYNNNLVPAFASFKAALEEYTDVAEYIAKLGIDTGVKDSDVGSVGAGQFDAARNL